MLTNFTTKTVDSVLSAFNKTLADLNTIAERENDNANQYVEQAKQANERASASLRERDRAKNVAAKIQSFIEA